MKRNADSKEDYLDVCYFQSVWSPNARKNTVYCMTLLAYAAVQRNKNMMDVLIEYGASKVIHNVNVYYLPQHVMSLQSLGSVMR